MGKNYTFEADLSTYVFSLMGVATAAIVRYKLGPMLKKTIPSSDPSENNKSLTQSGNTIFVALSGYGQPSDFYLLTKARFDYHVVKPLAIDSLIELLSNAQRSAGKTSGHT
ncbi:hypothetical protein ABIB38_004286 [Massilia sp. UYP11]|uniref:hypothetical protein n=1 Tax=Massilia sp. UYP11 TaxID=1756385 RepID=UPI003D1AC834